MTHFVISMDFNGIIAPSPVNTMGAAISFCFLTQTHRYIHHQKFNIEGHVDLARDRKTSAIVNVNSIDYQHYVASRNAKKSKCIFVMVTTVSQGNLGNLG